MDASELEPTMLELTEELKADELTMLLEAAAEDGSIEEELMTKDEPSTEEEAATDEDAATEDDVTTAADPTTLCELVEAMALLAPEHTPNADWQPEDALQWSSVVPQ
jgi:hypothetical protein